MRCHLCSSPGPFAQPPAPPGFHLYDCAACGLVFLHPLPSEAELASYYDQHYYGHGRKKFSFALEAAIRQLNRIKWRRLRPLLRTSAVSPPTPPPRLLDIGCGRGTMVRLAREEGLEAYGIERDFPHGEPYPHIYYKDLFDCGFPSAHFQLVILWHVLEHLEDPARTLAEIHRILAPGGWLSLAVPNYGGAQAQASGKHWFHLDLPRHFLQFRPATLRRLVEQQGFRVAHSSTFSFEYDWFGTLQSWLNRGVGDNNGLYEVLKGTSDVTRLTSIRRLTLAAGLALPALGGAVWDAARGRGGTLFLLLQKKP